MVVNGVWKKTKNSCHVMEQNEISCHGEVRVGMVQLVADCWVALVRVVSIVR